MKAQPRFALCVQTAGSEDLEPRKVYQILSDRAAGRDGYLRIVDESGEDYLYPAELFVPVTLPPSVVRDLGRETVEQKRAITRPRPTTGSHHRRRVMRLRAARG